MALKSLLSQSALTLTASHTYFAETNPVSVPTLLLSAGIIEFKDFDLEVDGVAVFDTIESNPVAFRSTSGPNEIAGFAYLFNTHNLDPDQSGGGGAGLVDGDYGDIVVGGTGTTMTIEADAVTNAKLANMATMTIKGNNSGGSANPTDLSVADVKTMLNLAGTNTGDQTSIVGITGSLAEFNAALTGADFATGGGTATGTNTGDQNVFTTIAVSGQSNVVADGTSDTLTLIAGANITITTNATNDEITITAATTGGSTLADGDYGDVTASGSGTVITIDNDVVTNAKLANMATQTFKGRTTAGTGDPEDLSIAQAKALLDLTGTNSGDQTITLTSDVTGSGTGSFATTIANNAVSNAKAADMAANTIKGNNTGASGDPLDLTIAQVKTMLDLTGTNSGDQTITLTGDVTGSGTGSFAATIAANSVTNTKLADMAASTLKGNNTGGSADPADLTVAQVKTLLAYTPGDIGAQTADATLTALAGYNTNGILTQTAPDTFVGRTITGTANQVSVADGNGVSANPTLSLSSTLVLPGTVQIAQNSLQLRDTNNTHNLIINAGSDLTAARTFTLVTGDSDRTLTMAGDATISGTNSGDQTITLTGNVTGSGTGSFATTIASGVVANSMLANMAALTIKGNNTGGAADPADLTVAQVKTMLDLTGTNSGDQTITLTGNVTGSGTGSFATTIAAGVVTNSMLADVATATFKGRTTAGTGSPEDLSVAQAKTLLNLTGTNSGDQTITLTGDVIGSGTGSFATNIPSNTVTYAKMQNASAGNVVLARAAATSGDYSEVALAASQLLGRGSTGDVAAITLGTNLSMSGTTLNASGGGGGPSLPVINNAKETATTTGTGNFTLAGAASGYQALNDAHATNVWFEYAIVMSTEWEIGLGYLSAASTLVRSRVYMSSNANAAVNFSAGTKDVFCTVSGFMLDSLSARIQSAPYAWR